MKYVDDILDVWHIIEKIKNKFSKNGLQKNKSVAQKNTLVFQKRVLQLIIGYYSKKHKKI